MSSNDKDNRKGTFVFYEDWWNVISSLEPSIKANCFDSLCRYAFFGEEPDDPTIKAITGLMLRTIDRDKEKWESAREQRIRAIQSRWDRVKSKNHTSVLSRNTKDTSVLPRNTKDTVNVKCNNVNVSSKDDNNLSTKVERGEPDNPQVDPIDFNAFVRYWNKTFDGTAVSGIRSLTDGRKRKLRKIVNKYGKDALYEVIHKIHESSFINNRDRSWLNFDWLIEGKEGDHFLRVLEGSYDDKQNSNKEQEQQKKTDEYEDLYNTIQME